MRDTDRGVDPRPAGVPGGSVTGHPELEELPAQSVIPQGSPRLGLGGSIAVVAMAVLLAAGFGVLGGRPDATPGATTGALASPARPAPTPALPSRAPLVTPWTVCGAPPQAVPVIELQVNGQPYPGFTRGTGPTDEPLEPSPTLGVESRPPVQTIVVPVDVISEIWIGGAACARAWEINLLPEEAPYSIGLEAFVSRGAGEAAQNRFTLGFGEVPPGLALLRADLELDFGTVAATWLVDIVQVPLTPAALEHEGESIEVVQGCDVTLTLATGSGRSLNPCVDDVKAPPFRTGVVAPGARLTFAFEDWSIDNALVFCGRLNGQSFVAQPEPGCEEASDQAPEFTFAVPEDEGRWTLAISACAARVAHLGPGSNRLCGTWYANIEVREGA